MECVDLSYPPILIANCILVLKKCANPDRDLPQRSLQQPEIYPKRGALAKPPDGYENPVSSLDLAFSGRKWHSVGHSEWCR
jgi:hypothetical protein